MTLRVAWVPFSTDSRVGSVRLRTLRPLRYLAADGWDVGLFQPGERPDIAIFQKAYEQEHLRLAADLKRRGTRIVADFCDNHTYHDGSPSNVDRASRMLAMRDLADAVVVPTEALASAVAATAHVVPDAIEVPGASARHLFDLTRRATKRQRLRLMWFGAAASGSQHGGMRGLRDVMPLLRELNDRVALRLVVISNDRSAFQEHVGADPLANYIPWRRSIFSMTAAASDVALLPNSMNPFTMCKSSNRPATALLHGLACVADAIPSYTELGNGVRSGNWRESLLAYVDEGRRAADVEMGRAKALALYAQPVVTRRWADVLHQVL